MDVLDGERRAGLAALFDGYEWNYLPEAILEGHMGRALADAGDDPRAAVLEATNIQLSILGGDARHPSARRFVEHELPAPSALLFASDGWDELLWQVHAGKLLRMARHAFTSERLDVELLRALAARVPDGYRLAPMDLGLAEQIAAEKGPFAADHMVNFESPRDFVERGFGFCLLHGDRMVSAASTFAVCSRGIEIQVDTRPEHRREGLATALAANLLVASLERGLDPNWDAANDESVALASKLGYTPQGEYPMVVYAGSKALVWLSRIRGRIKRLVRR